MATTRQCLTPLMRIVSVWGFRPCTAAQILMRAITNMRLAPRWMLGVAMRWGGNISGSVFPFAGDEFVYTYNGVEGSTLTWSVDGGEIIAAGTSEVTVLWGTEDTFGAVYVFEEDATGCQGEAVRTVQILDVSNVDDLEVVQALLMPNPARGQVSLVWDVLEYTVARVVVYDVLGAEVMTATTTGTMDIQSLAPGRYTVVASSGDAEVTLPLMVK